MTEAFEENKKLIEGCEVDRVSGDHAIVKRVQPKDLH